VQLELVTSVLVAIGVVSAWRGAWLVLDGQLLPGHPLASAAVSLVTGCVLLAVLSMLQPWLGHWARRHPGRAWWVADSAFTIAGLWVCVLVWRGVWQLWDHALGVGFAPGPPNLLLARGGWISHAAGLAVLLPMDALRSLNAPPMILSTDSAPPLFGARVTAGWHGVTWLRRWQTPPMMLRTHEWRSTVGLPAAKAGRGFGGLPVPEMSVHRGVSVITTGQGITA
jgi:hypothetical protein